MQEKKNELRKKNWGFSISKVILIDYIYIIYYKIRLRLLLILKENFKKQLFKEWYKQNEFADFCNRWITFVLRYIASRSKCLHVWNSIHINAYTAGKMINNTHGTQCDVAKKTRWKFVPKISKRFYRRDIKQYYRLIRYSLPYKMYILWMTVEDEKIKRFLSENKCWVCA